MKWNLVFYLILCCISLASILAGPIPVIRSWNGCVSSMASIAHLVMVVWTAKKRFDNAGDMCMITAPQGSMLKQHAEFLRLVTISQIFLLCPMFFCQNAGFKYSIADDEEIEYQQFHKNQIENRESN